MKVTPLEIRQKSFEKNFRGYDKDEVNAFLLTLSQEWERMLEEYKEMRIKLEASEREVVKLREVENSLFKTLKTAEDTGANLIDQANKAADLQLQEAKMTASGIISEARLKAKSVAESAENRARAIISAMEDEVKMLKQKHKTAENDLEDILYQLRNVAKEVLQKVDKADAQRSDRMKKKGEEAEQLVDELNHFNAVVKNIRAKEPEAKEEANPTSFVPTETATVETAAVETAAVETTAVETAAVETAAEDNAPERTEVTVVSVEPVPLSEEGTGAEKQVEQPEEEEPEEVMEVSEKPEKKSRSFFDEIE